MNGMTRSLCTFEDIKSQEYGEGCRRLRLTLHDQNQASRSSEPNRDKPIGRAFALVQPAADRTTSIPEPVKSTEEQVEVIKVYLEARRQEQQKHQQSLKMLSDEVSQIQEVRYCLKNLREQMAAKNKPHTNGWKVGIPFKKSSSTAPKGGAKADVQAESSRLRDRLSDEEEKLKVSEEDGERKDRRIEELQRLLGGMEQESATLRDAIRNREDELRELHPD